jgi:hypothetical protein
MVSPIFLFFVSLPVAFRIIPMLVPEAYLEPYAWWDARILNVPSDAGQKGWRNMGYWKVGSCANRNGVQLKNGEHGRLLGGCRGAGAEAAGLCRHEARRGYSG